MNRRYFLSGLATALLSCTRDARRRLNVYNWSEYIGENTLRQFTAETGITVRYQTFESAEELVAKVISGNSGWDVVFPSNSYVEPLREMNLLAKLDRSRLPLAGNLMPRFESPPWDRALEWSVPYMHGATGIVYSTAAPEPATWGALWSGEYRRRVTMLDDPAEVFGASLKRLGHSVNATEPSELAAAKRLAITQKPQLLAYINAEVRDQLIAGDVLAAQSWSITAQQAVEQSGTQSKPLKFVYPAEGFPLYCDCAVILRESRRIEAAHLFLNYLLRGDVAAAIATEMRTATTNRAAYDMLPAPDRENTTLYPDSKILDAGEWFRAIPAAAQRLRDRYWTEVKSA